VLLSLVVAASSWCRSRVRVRQALAAFGLEGALGVVAAGRYLGRLGSGPWPRPGIRSCWVRDGDRLAAALRPAACNPLPRAWALSWRRSRRPAGPGLAWAVGRRGGRILAMTLASRQPGQRLVRLTPLALAAAVVLAVSPWGEKVVSTCHSSAPSTRVA
jgi:hypothetical protein